MGSDVGPVRSHLCKVHDDQAKRCVLNVWIILKARCSIPTWNCSVYSILAFRACWVLRRASSSERLHDGWFRHFGERLERRCALPSGGARPMARRGPLRCHPSEAWISCSRRLPPYPGHEVHDSDNAMRQGRRVQRGGEPFGQELNRRAPLHRSYRRSSCEMLGRAVTVTKSVEASFSSEVAALCGSPPFHHCRCWPVLASRRA